MWSSVCEHLVHFFLHLPLVVWVGGQGVQDPGSCSGRGVMTCIRGERQSEDINRHKAKFKMKKLNVKEVPGTVSMVWALYVYMPVWMCFTGNISLPNPSLWRHFHEPKLTHGRYLRGQLKRCRFSTLDIFCFIIPHGTMTIYYLMNLYICKLMI